MEVIADTIGMSLRNPKVALQLLPSAVSGFVLNEHKSKQKVGLVSNHEVCYDFTYSNTGNPEFMNLYEKAKKGQWNSNDLAWDTDVDPYHVNNHILPEKLLPMYGLDFYMKTDERHKNEVGHSTSSWLLSQFLHGEQGAVYAASQTIEATPWFGAKLYGSTQVMDEARHVEVFHKYITEKLESLYKINDNLYTIIHALATDSNWDIKFLGMQIMIEGLALGAFGLFYKHTKEPLLKQLLKNVISDEARHVHYGVEALRDFYTKESNEKFRREREDWAYEVAIMLKNRFYFLEIYDEYYGHLMTRSQWKKMVDESEIMKQFRINLFSRLIPNLKAIGLFTERIQPHYEKLGLLKFKDGSAADKLSLNDLLK